MSLVINPGSPEVTETRVVKAAVPATVTVTMPLREALILSALQGRYTGNNVNGSTLYNGLRGGSGYGWQELSDAIGDAVAFGGDGGYQRRNVALHAVKDRLDAAIATIIKERNL